MSFAYSAYSTALAVSGISNDFNEIIFSKGKKKKKK